MYTNVLANVIVRIPHPWSRDSQDQESFLAFSAEKQNRKYDTECSNHNPSLLTQRSKELSCSRMKWWAIYTNSRVNATVNLPQPLSGGSQGQDTFLVSSADKQTHNYDTECFNYSVQKIFPYIYILYIYIYIYIIYIYIYIYLLLLIPYYIGLNEVSLVTKTWSFGHKHHQRDWGVSGKVAL